MGTKQNPGKFDCYKAAEPDEPMFVLLARDRQAPALIRKWANEREMFEGKTEKVIEARQTAVAMDEWRKKNRKATP